MARSLASQGTIRLVGNDPGRVRSGIASILAGGPVQPVSPPRWDGQAGRRIAEVLAGRLAGGSAE